MDRALNRTPIEPIAVDEKTSEYFGIDVFNRQAMRKYLSKATFQQISDAIDQGTTLDRSVAEHVAAGLRMWAMEKGATHYTHWFHPLTDGTAEKHDAFVESDGNGGLIEELCGKLLAQQEPDASSFPSGGLRNTFEARGYSAWDPSSPAFIVDKTLCIPTVFIAYTGEALDYKTPLLKSISAMNKAATAFCKYFSLDVEKVITYLGWEQEYFLVDEALYQARPDLSLTKRTLMGHESAKNQQLEDHYFGAIPPRVQAYMKDLEYACYRLGIPVKTRHNEVAPNQFELAPIYEEANLAVDHNLLLMSVMKKVARRHKFRVLLHEKPFNGVNGSGKHCNWSIGTDKGVNLISPGKDQIENLRFICLIANILMAVYENNALLKASISSATNEHRLGGNEAPPAIISSFLGAQINDILDKFENSNEKDAVISDSKKKMRLGVGQIPELLIDNTDRNRTSPFAFTGNRFEFRAVGSSANCASAMIALNAAIAHRLTQFTKDVEQLMNQGKTKEEALFDVTRSYIRISKPIRFDGNGYSEEWKQEAKSRGLDCETSVPVIYDAYMSAASVKMFKEAQIFTEVELHARNEVKWEIYTKKIQIESRVLGDLAMNHIIPVGIRYQTLLIENAMNYKQLFNAQDEDITEIESLIKEMKEYLSAVRSKVAQMTEARKIANHIEDGRAKAIAYHDTVLPFLNDIRKHIDKLELIVDNEMWPLPKYRELMFVR